MNVLPGRPYPLGATLTEGGVDFAIFSGVAQQVELCLFDAAGTETRLPLPQRTGQVWHGHVPGIGPGQRYGYRVLGPYAPEAGIRCNAAKLLLDPYARAVEGQVRWDPSVYPYVVGDPAGDLSRSDTDDAACVPRSVVVDPTFDWGGDRAPNVALQDSVIYEAHVRGMTMQHPDVPPALRGTFAGLATEPVIRHLTRLGVTAVELMPVHQFVHRQRLCRLGLRNYWGYDSVCYLAPHNGYSSSGQAGQQVREFQEMVRTLHAAGLEVILDVVFNHTAEGDQRGPALCFRGIDNAAYYRLAPGDPRQYVDLTGTGNSVNAHHPFVLQLVMDSLRCWVLEMHVDGFRFDLAPELARTEADFDRLSDFLEVMQQDPVVSRVKLFAEPWDVGPGGYQLGAFPARWSEWNGQYRDTVRDYLRADGGTLGDFATRLAGSSDVYQPSGRAPQASLNFVTAHDGFTLRDLVSYEEKHNLANGEDNRDGSSHNLSWNCGVEGETTDAGILRLRARQQRNFLATLLLSMGVPMLLGGDEIGRTQAGNNNAYCQDNPVSWLDWAHADADLLAFAARVVHLRRRHPVFRRSTWLSGAPGPGGLPDVAWLRPDGVPMEPADWRSADARSVAVFLNGQGIPELDRQGNPTRDDSFLLLFNPGWDDLELTLPGPAHGSTWSLVFDTASPEQPENARSLAAGAAVTVTARSIQVLRRP